MLQKPSGIWCFRKPRPYVTLSGNNLGDVTEKTGETLSTTANKTSGSQVPPWLDPMTTTGSAGSLYAPLPLMRGKKEGDSLWLVTSQHCTPDTTWPKMRNEKERSTQSFRVSFEEESAWTTGKRVKWYNYLGEHLAILHETEFTCTWLATPLSGTGPQHMKTCIYTDLPTNFTRSFIYNPHWNHLAPNKYPPMR